MNARIIQNVSLALLGATAAAQAVPPVAFCCKYLYSLSAPGGGAACDGSVTTSCETDSTGSDEGEPLSRKKHRGLTRPAKCSTWNLGSGGYFIRSDCTEPPSSGAKFVGDFGDGVCCWAAGPHLPTVTTTNQSFHVSVCLGSCPDGGIH